MRYLKLVHHTDDVVALFSSLLLIKLCFIGHIISPSGNLAELAVIFAFGMYTMSVNTIGKLIRNANVAAILTNIIVTTTYRCWTKSYSKYRCRQFFKMKESCHGLNEFGYLPFENILCAKWALWLCWTIAKNKMKKWIFLNLFWLRYEYHGH